MSPAPSPHSTFEIVSGQLCYGALNNIWHGASGPVHPFPREPPFRQGGTTVSQVLNHHIPARKGVWRAYRLRHTPVSQVCGWFACHSDINPGLELTRILNISGSPYEQNPGSTQNDEKTYDGAVLVLNRYDWDWYDSRGANDMAENEELDIQAPHVGVGVVDTTDALSILQEWRLQMSQDRGTSTHAIWMHIPDMEYMFGRFGFDAERTVAESFLFFSMGTDFDKTVLEGTDQRVRSRGNESQEEIQAQAAEPDSKIHDLGDGIRRLNTHASMRSVTVPEDDELLGPYTGEQYIFPESQIEIIKERLGERGLQFQQKRKPESLRCLNEMVLTFLESHIAKVGNPANIKAAADSLFPRHEIKRSIDDWLHRCMTKPDTMSQEGLDMSTIIEKTKSFLISHDRGNGLFADQTFLLGAVSCVIYLAKEIIELANGYARMSSRKRIFPLDIRMCVTNDNELLMLLKNSRYYWRGSGLE